MSLPDDAAAILTARHHPSRTRFCQHLTLLGSPSNLSILAHLDDGPRAAVTLEGKVGSHSSYINTALRSLVRAGLVAASAPGEPLYRLTPYGRSLLGALASVVAPVPKEDADHD